MDFAAFGVHWIFLLKVEDRFFLGEAMGVIRPLIRPE